MKRIFLVPLALALLFPFTSAPAAPATPAEKIEATRACAEVVKQSSPQMRPDDIRYICEASSQPVDVWHCAKKRMNQGAPFGPAIEHCKTASK